MESADHPKGHAAAAAHPGNGLFPQLIGKDQHRLGYVADETSSRRDNSGFRIASGLLFVGYAVFEVSSNLMPYKVGARKWLARIMISWGAVAAATDFVDSEASLYVLRILLSVAEARFCSGMILCFALWIPRQLRGTILSLVVLGGTVASVFGSPVTGLLLTPKTYFGVESWRAMFVVEGTPALTSTGMSRHALLNVCGSFGGPELTRSGLQLARTACGCVADGAGHFQRGGVP